MADAAPATTPAPATQIPGVTDPNYKPPEGHLGNLTAAQLETLDKFRSELQESGAFVESRMDDALLLRYVGFGRVTLCMLSKRGLQVFASSKMEYLSGQRNAS